MGKFPVGYIGHMISGAGMGGLVPSLANVAILAANAASSAQSANVSPNFQWAGVACFALAEVAAVACLALYVVMERRPFYRFYSLGMLCSDF